MNIFLSMDFARRRNGSVTLVRRKAPATIRGRYASYRSSAHVAVRFARLMLCTGSSVCATRTRRSGALQIMHFAGEDLGWVGGIGAAVPGEEAARDVAGHGVEFFAQDFAADGEALFRIAKRGEKEAVKAGFARDLPHHLHQSPTEAAGVSFRGADFIVGVERRDVFGEEKRLVAHGPGIPRGFLLDDSADESGVERARRGGFAREGDKL